MTKMDLPNTLLYLSPTVFDSLHSQRLVVTPNADHLDSMNDIIARHMPDQALPVPARELAIVLREGGNTWIGNQDTFWRTAGVHQSYIPADELWGERSTDTHAVNKLAIMRSLRPVLEFSISMPTHDLTTEAVTRQWIARRTDGNLVSQTWQEVSGAILEIPGVGPRKRRMNRVVQAIGQAGLQPFCIGNRESK